ncbi:radical SAM protein [Candidatus Thorarchaeota archaeon]|nr:MAG: radical SAM protein [Candidatus Thorarchaeota archaeon]
MKSEELLRLKVRLLTEGATLPENEWSGRKGGAGPVGGRYFILPNGRSCGIPIRSKEQAIQFNSAPLEMTRDPSVWIYDHSIQLRIVPRPRFYDLKTDDGIPYHQIALLHGDRTLATTVYQYCRYWENGTQCKFCTIPFSYQSGDTILKKSSEQITEVVQAAQKEGVIDNVLLTTGSPDSEDIGTSHIIDIIRVIRKDSSIPIGVQFEPPVEVTDLQAVFDAGASAVGMHIETTDESIREEICPGKYHYGSLALYRTNWQNAIKIFPKGNVSTFILHGLGEDLQESLFKIRELAELGVMPVVAPFRPASGSQLSNYLPSYVGKLDESVEFYKQVGKILYENGLNPEKTFAGCHKCGGCTPIQEAYDWFEAINASP